MPTSVTKRYETIWRNTPGDSVAKAEAVLNTYLENPRLHPRRHYSQLVKDYFFKKNVCG